MSEKNVILLVGSTRSNLEPLSLQLTKEGHETLCAASLEELDHIIQDKKNVGIALIDLSGFDDRIWERCAALRDENIPFIVISPQRSPAIQRDSIKYGASGLLVKPLGVKEMVEHIHTLLGE